MLWYGNAAIGMKHPFAFVKSICLQKDLNLILAPIHDTKTCVQSCHMTRHTELHISKKGIMVNLFW